MKQCDRCGDYLYTRQEICKCEEWQYVVDDHCEPSTSNIPQDDEWQSIWIIARNSEKAAEKIAEYRFKKYNTFQNISLWVRKNTSNNSKLFDVEVIPEPTFNASEI